MGVGRVGARVRRRRRLEKKFEVLSMENRLNIFDQYYDLLLWYMQHIEKYPRSYKFTLGDELKKNLLKALENLTECRYSRKGKSLLLKEINIKLENVRILTRLSHDLKVLNTKSYVYAIKQLEEIGKKVGGWKKWSGRDAKTVRRPVRAGM